MGITERREREKEALRTRIVEAARDIISEEGLDALSMRAIAERIEYSPATIYLYFRDKDDLLRDVVHAGFHRMSQYMEEELAEVGKSAGPDLQYRAQGRAYARFALENTAYFRVMFELPTVAQMECPQDCGEQTMGMGEVGSWENVVETVQKGMDAGLFRMPSARRGAVVGWGMIHGLTSLYLSGHLVEDVASHGDFLDLIEEAMAMLRVGWSPSETSAARGA